MMTIRLRCGPTACEVAPEIGGAILSLSVGGVPILRPTLEGCRDVLDTACFPLVPFANRIDSGQFVFRGREILLPEDPAAPPHAHHGQGWRRMWTADRTGEDYADLSLLHERDDWPWRYRATQNLKTTADGLSVEVSAFSSVMPRSRRSDAGPITGWKTPTCRSEDGSERCSGSDG